MAFFGLFGNKEKKNTEAASSGKKKIELQKRGRSFRFEQN